MRLRVLYTTALTAIALAACSSADDAVPNDGDGSGTGWPAPDGGSKVAPRPQDPPPNDAIVATDGGTNTRTDAGADSRLGPAVPSTGGTCSTNGLYCGGDKVTGNPNTLYKCNGPGPTTVVEACAMGCVVNAGQDDACKTAAPPPGARVPSPVPGKVVTYPFGVKNSGYAAGYHTGEDYATATGSDAIAVRSGTIRWSNDNGGAYGKWIGLDADNGRTYVYCHLSQRIAGVGATVVAGQLLAKTGATGNVTGPHLHFEDHSLGPFTYAQVRQPSW